MSISYETSLPPLPRLGADIQQRVTLFVTAAVIAATYALAHVYRGIIGDASLYAAQALNRVAHDSPYATDLFFRFGSQDRYTLFSPPYGWLINGVGLDSAAFIVTVGGMVATLYALGRVLHFEGARWSATLGCITVAAFPSWFGADHALEALQSFATPRSLAAALVLFVCAASLRRQWWSALLFLAAASCVQPIMALPGVILLALMRCTPRQLAALCFAGVLALVLGIVTGVPLVDRLLESMPANWLAAVAQRSPWLFVSTWDLEDWNVAATAILGCLLVGVRVRDDLRRLFVSASVTASLGLVVAAVGGDLFHSVLILQIQPWRFAWVAQTFAVGGAGLLWARYIEARGTEDLVAAFGLSAALLLTASSGSAAIALALIMLYVLRATADARYSKGALVVAGVVFAQGLFWHVANFSSWYWMQRAYARYATIVPVALRDPVVLCCVAGVLCWLVHRRSRVFLRGGAIACATLFFGAGVYAWAEAYTVDRDQHRGYVGLDEVRRRIPVEKGILWGDDANVAWFALHRPSYMSVIQTAGIVFSEQTTLEAQRRSDAIERVLGPLPFMRWTVKNMQPVDLDVSKITALCKDPELGGVFTQSRSVGTGVPIASSDGRPLGRVVVCDEMKTQ